MNLQNSIISIKMIGLIKNIEDLDMLMDHGFTRNTHGGCPGLNCMMDNITYQYISENIIIIYSSLDYEFQRRSVIINKVLILEDNDWEFYFEMKKDSEGKYSFCFDKCEVDDLNDEEEIKKFFQNNKENILESLHKLPLFLVNFFFGDYLDIPSRIKSANSKITMNEM